jgi:hypothetical protein
MPANAENAKTPAAIYFEGDTGGVLYFDSFKTACREARAMKRAYPDCYVEVISNVTPPPYDPAEAS